jgi:hypothetical protein
MVVMAVVLVVIVVAFGVLFLRLHTLPERIAHKSHKFQFEIVAVLGLLALFTHMHIFWVAGLLLALIDFPDLGGWLARIAGSVEKIAENKAGESAAEAPPEVVADIKRGAPAIKMPHENVASIRREGVAPASSELMPRSTGS